MLLQFFVYRIADIMRIEAKCLAFLFNFFFVNSDPTRQRLTRGSGKIKLMLSGDVSLYNDVEK